VRDVFFRSLELSAKNITHAAAQGLAGGVDWDLQCGSNSAYTHLDEAVKVGVFQVHQPVRTTVINWLYNY
jgi:hypothetical protein